MAMTGESGSAQGRGMVVPPFGGRTISLGVAGIVTMKADCQETGGTLSVYEFATPPLTAGPPLHLHRGWDEAFYVLEGEMTFLVDGQLSRAPAGTFVFIPRGVFHTFRNERDVPARQLVIFTPGGIEAYFDAVTDVMVAGGEGLVSTAAALMEQHDMIVPDNTDPAYGALARDAAVDERP